jgi:hypothetical protein
LSTARLPEPFLRALQYSCIRSVLSRLHGDLLCHTRISSLVPIYPVGVAAIDMLGDEEAVLSI